MSPGIWAPLGRAHHLPSPSLRLSLISGVMSGINQPPPPADLLKSIVGLPQAFIARVHHRHAAAAQRNGGRERRGTVYTGERKNANAPASKSANRPSLYPAVSLSIFLQVLNFANVRFIPVLPRY